MKQSTVINAYKTINKINGDKLPLKVSYALFKTKQLLQPHVDFQMQREKDVYSKYKYTVQHDGVIKFADKDTANEFADEIQKTINEMMELDVDLGQFNKQEIDASEDMQLSVSDIEALSPFIDFV